ncbi:hypothetical protein [Jannaschia aquimarina]|uniref:CopL family metal-binding regulatory protein n=1 Tax=Jannaschia aquimarina TaxID=935700 RepID=A0A0D1EHH1_9RHOB|nr:hypothetical protein [Jannaschia aquimarina]KIT17129.1 hypothetical protein jaqu_11710 [Jannaschia aquimarina]SNS47493.1 hypothetical protein SAMN05421775_10192 [Jannaschia aquimarina]
MLRVVLSLTLAVLLAVTGAASMAHGIGNGADGHHAAEGHESGHSHAASLEECCDAAGAGNGGCLIDAVAPCLSIHHLAAASPARLGATVPVVGDGRRTAVPTGPPKIRALA